MTDRAPDMIDAAALASTLAKAGEAFRKQQRDMQALVHNESFAAGLVRTMEAFREQHRGLQALRQEGHERSIAAGLVRTAEAFREQHRGLQALMHDGSIAAGLVRTAEAFREQQRDLQALQGQVRSFGAALRMAEESRVRLFATATEAARLIVEQNRGFGAASRAAAAAVQVTYAATVEPSSGWARADLGGLSATMAARVVSTAEAMPDVVQGETTADVLAAIGQLSNELKSTVREARAVQIATFIGVLIALLAFVRDLSADGWTGDEAAPPQVTVVVEQPPASEIRRFVDERLRELLDEDEAAGEIDGQPGGATTAGTGEGAIHPSDPADVGGGRPATG
jgi:hypothetical protein